MKKIRLLCGILISIPILLTSQVKGSKSIDVTAGYESNGALGFVGFSYFTETTRFWRGGVNFHLENFANTPHDIEVQLYTGQLEHYREVVSFYDNSSIIYLGAGLIGGYESINGGKALLPNNTKIHSESQFIYGGTAGIEFAQYLFGSAWRGNLKLVVNAGYNYYVNSDVGSVQPRIRGGFKYQF